MTTLGADDGSAGAAAGRQEPPIGALPRARGRPARFTPPSAHDHLPLTEPLDTLSPTARAMLDAGRRILAERGFRALTLEAVAHEAGASKTTVVEHFGNRAGFLAILFDSLMQDASVQIEMALQSHTDGSAEVRDYVGHLVELLTDVEAGRAFHEIAANALADDALRRRLAHLFAWYRDIGAHRLGLCRGSDAVAPDEMQGLAALLDAVEDGLALQRSMDPDNFDSRPALELFGRLIELFFADRARAVEGSREP